MATILTKKKDTTGAPSAGDLTNSTGGAELAVNTADKRLYTKNSSNAVVEVGTNPGEAVTFVAGSASTPAITTTGDTNTGIFFPAADTIAFAEGGAEAMRIDSSGNVGIGTTSPSGRLHISNGASTSLLYVTGQSRNALIGQNANGMVIYQEANAGMLFGTNNTERMRIDSSGNLLVGTTTPEYIGTFSSSTTGGVFAKTTASAAQFAVAVQNAATSGNNSFAVFGTEASFTTRGSIDYNRGAGLTRYNTTSDATLKNIIGDSDGQKSVEILNATRIREFAWKDDETQKPQIGVIAQELHETFKGAVSVGGDIEKQRDVTEEVEEEYTDEEGNTQTRTVTQVVGQETYTEYRPWAVDKTAFTFHLVAGWQAHEKIIKQQADMIAALEARIAALEQA
jgi:hypothetical protein